MRLIGVNGEQIGRIGVGVQPRRIVRNTEGPIGAVTGAVGAGVPGTPGHTIPETLETE